MRDAERAAHRARYGKLEPALYERLQQIGDEESILVAIWVAHHEVERSFEEIVDILIARYPAAETAWKETGILWAVDDAELAVEIQVEFERLLTENINLRSAAMIDWLRTEGFAAEPISGMPVISVKLPKRVILALNEREDVARIYAFDAEAVPASDIATQTDRAPAVWARGYKGNGIKVAILESGNITGNTANCVNVVATRSGTSSGNAHKNRVAAIAACNNSTKPGVASAVDIVDAGHNTTESDVVTALQWATEPGTSRRSYVVNQSERVQTDTNLHLVDHAYD